MTGQMIERGRVIRAENGGYVLESIDRPGYVTEPLQIKAGGGVSVTVTETEYIIEENGGGTALAVGDLVFFTEGADGAGMIIERIDIV